MKPWSHREIEKLKRMQFAHKSMRDMADELDRSVAAVSAKLKSLRKKWAEERQAELTRGLEDREAAHVAEVIAASDGRGFHAAHPLIVERLGRAERRSAA